MPARTAPADTAVSLQSLHALLYMLVRKQMILTIFVVAVTLGAETEFQIVSVQLRSAADRAFVAGLTGCRGRRLNLGMVGSPADRLLR